MKGFRTGFKTFTEKKPESKEGETLAKVAEGKAPEETSSQVKSPEKQDKSGYRGSKQFKNIEKGEDYETGEKVFEI